MQKMVEACIARLFASVANELPFLAFASRQTILRHTSFCRFVPILSPDIAGNLTVAHTESFPARNQSKEAKIRLLRLGTHGTDKDRHSV